MTAASVPSGGCVTTSWGVFCGGPGASQLRKEVTVPSRGSHLGRGFSSSLRVACWPCGCTPLHPSPPGQEGDVQVLGSETLLLMKQTGWVSAGTSRLSYRQSQGGELGRSSRKYFSSSDSDLSRTLHVSICPSEVREYLVTLDTRLGVLGESQLESTWNLGLRWSVRAAPLIWAKINFLRQHLRLTVCEQGTRGPARPQELGCGHSTWAL